MQSALLGSAAGLLVPFAIAKFQRIEYVSIWLACRAAAQIVITILPNPANELFRRPGDAEGGSVAALIEGGLAWFYLRLFFVLIPIAWLAIALIYTDAISGLVEGLLAVYVSLFIVSSLMSVLLRVRLRADLTRILAAQDLCFSLLAVVAVYFSFYVLVMAYAVREIFKIAFLSKLLENSTRIEIPWQRTYVQSAWIYARNIVQVLSQYAERLAIPAIFGLTISGYSGLGSTIGVSVVILSSTLYVWAFSDILAGNSESADKVIVEFSLLMMVSASLCWWVLFAASFFEWSGALTEAMAFTSTFSSSAGLSFLILARSEKAMTRTGSAFKHMAALCGVYAGIYIAHVAGLSFSEALVVGLGLNCMYIVMISSDIGKMKHLLVTTSCLVLFGAYWFACFYFNSGFHWSFLPNSLFCLFIACALSTPYGLHLIRKGKK